MTTTIRDINELQDRRIMMEKSCRLLATRSFS